MEKEYMLQPGEIYNLDDKPFQIIALAENAKNGESMVVYQLLYGSFRIYVEPLSAFLRERDNSWDAGHSNAKSIPEAEAMKVNIIADGAKDKVTCDGKKADPDSRENGDRDGHDEEQVNPILLEFLDADTYSKKLSVITSHSKDLNDRLINDMAVSLDCSVEEGPIEERIQGLIYCLKTMTRFEDRRY